LKKCLLRRIGDGSTTDIWRDRWLPNHFGGRPIAVPNNPQVHMVSDLITPSKVWNESLMRQIFVDAKLM